jgi:N-acetylneuraminic acid mutarotase
MADMPMPISNNAVSQAVVSGVPYVYSFAGIDSTKIYSGINLKSFRYNTQTDRWDSLPDLPDVIGKIAAGASTVKNKIYIIGGYSVAANGTETSSDKVHIFNPVTNQFEADGSPLPLAIDDHVQGVYKDSLIYVITGWSNTNNRTNVQIYDVVNDNWLSGTPVPNFGQFKSFGSSGVIYKNTIYYFGGASAASGFPIQNNLRIGAIDSLDPTQISWRDTVLSPNLVGYRMAAAVIDDVLNWIGGADQTYNYDGLAYSTGQGVPPNNRRLRIHPGDLSYDSDTSLTIPYPMDLRGIAETGSETFYLAGGMEANQTVSSKTLKLEYVNLFNEPEEILESRKLNVYPSPARDILYLEKPLEAAFEISNAAGQVVMREETGMFKSINISSLEAGFYVLNSLEGMVRFTKQ